MVLENPEREAFDALLADGALVAVDFYATWCAPCRAYSPKFSRIAREVARERPDLRVTFVAIDVDRRQEIARRHSVRSVPTTVVLREKKGLLGRRRVEVLRYAGDKPWPEMLRAFLALPG